MSIFSALSQSIYELIVHDSARDPQSPAARLKPESRAQLAKAFALRGLTDPEAIRDALEDELQRCPHLVVTVEAANG